MRKAFVTDITGQNGSYLSELPNKLLNFYKPFHNPICAALSVSKPRFLEVMKWLVITPPIWPERHSE